MKRLLALIGFISFSVLTAAFYLGVKAAVIIGTVSLFLFVLSLSVPKIRKEKTYPVSFITSFIASVIFLSFTFVNVYPVWNTYDGRNREIRATLTKDASYSGSYYNYELKVKSIGDREVNTKLFLNTKSPLVSEPYDEIILECELLKVTDASLMSKGIFLESYIYEEPEYEVYSPHRKPLMYHILKFNSFLRRGIYGELSEGAADFSSALLLGDKYAIESDIKELLRINGLSHISVVSGLHLSIISALFYKLFGKVVKNRYISGSLTIIGILFFTAFTGFGFSVIRAAVLQIIYIFGRMISRRHDPLNSLGFAALFVILINPYCVGDIGIHLSFLATLGILLLYQRPMGFIMNRVEKRKLFKKPCVNKLTRGFFGSAITTLCATLFTLPVSMLVFGGFSAVGVVTNVLLVPCLYIIIVSLVLCALFHYVTFLPLLADTFAFVVELYYELLLLVCKTFSKMEFAYIRTDEVYFRIWLGLSFLLLSIAVLIKRRRVYVCTAVMSLLILFAGGISYYVARYDVVTLSVPYTGDGLTVIISNNEDHAVLTFGGNKGKLYLLEKKLETMTPSKTDMLLSTCGKNHEFFEENLLREFDYGNVLLYDNKDEGSSRDLSQLPENITLYSGNYTIDLWDRAEARVCTDADMVYEYVTVGDKDILILTERLDAENIPKEHRSPDILITRDIPHNAALLSCETLIIPGDDYKALAGAEVLSPIAGKIMTGNDITLDIDS